MIKKVLKKGQTNGKNVKEASFITLGLWQY